jgi:hypothetical protein
MRDPAPWQKKYSRMLLLACLFGLFSQYLFIEKAAGISVVLFIFGFYCLFFYAVGGRLGGFERWKGQVHAGWLLMIPIGLLAMTYTLYANDLFRVLNGLALPFLIAVQTMLITGTKLNNWPGRGMVRDVFHQSVVQPLSHFPIPFGMIRSWVPDASNERTDSIWGRLRKVSIGLLLALPVLLIVISLLASADRIFQSWLAEIPLWLKGVSFGEGILRAGVAILISLYTFGYLWGLLFPRTITTEGPDSITENSLRIEKRKFSLDPIIVATLLVSVNFVYALFTAIQFSYLFGAANGLLPAGVAYAEYARRGFAELVLVALINLGLLLIGLHFVRRSGQVSDIIRRVLLSVLVICTVTMLASAYSRLSLYEEAYGFTQTRLLVHGFMLFLGVLLAVSFFRIWRESFSLSQTYLCCSIIAYVIINYINIDYQIASNNIERYERTGVIDMDYLGKLSTDAAPALLRLQVKQPDLLELKVVVDRLRLESQHDSKWPSWNVSKMRVKRD